MKLALPTARRFSPFSTLHRVVRCGRRFLVPRSSPYPGPVSQSFAMWFRVVAMPRRSRLCGTCLDTLVSRAGPQAHAMGIASLDSVISKRASRSIDLRICGRSIRMFQHEAVLRGLAHGDR